MENATEYFAPAGSYTGPSTPVNYPAIPYIHSTIDYDNGGAPSSEGNLRENDTYKYRQFIKPYVVKCYPRTNFQVYGGVATIGYALTPRKTKYDVQYANAMLFYGYRWLLDKLNNGQYGSMRLKGKCYVTFIGRLA